MVIVSRARRPRRSGFDSFGEIGEEIDRMTEEATRTAEREARRAEREARQAGGRLAP